jgi:predicted transcriptional regulator of viral defense system
MEMLVSLPTNFARIATVAEILSAVKAPALTSYELATLLYRSGFFEESSFPKTEYDNVLKSLKDLHLLSPTESANAYLLFGRTTIQPAEIACAIDPFAYVSHLSAMEHHGLTDRFSKILYMTRPSLASWKEQASERMQKDLGSAYDVYRSSELPVLSRPRLNKINKTSIHFEERSQLGAFRHVSDTSLRVATIGRVFLDMIREPELCGGIQHVIDIYKAEAQRYLKFIVDEVDRHGKPIDKVRTGYLLSEVCNLEDSVLHQWEAFAQRGGSRKLDAAEEYVPNHSERWKLSINVPSLLTAHASEKF